MEKSIIKKGEVIGFQTDTVWGLGCLPNDFEAVEKIYEIKNRDRSKPLILMSHDVKYLENGIRDPRAFVNTKKLAEFKKELENFAKNAIDSKNVTKFAQKAKWAKGFNILANISLSSFLLAYALPKAQFAFRKIVTGSDLDPGLATSKDKI